MSKNFRDPNYNIIKNNNSPIDINTQKKISIKCLIFVNLNCKNTQI